MIFLSQFLKITCSLSFFFFPLSKEMSKSELDGLSLGQLFSKGQAVLTELDEISLSSIDPEYQKTVQRGLEYLQRADTLIARLDIFSENEIIDDINTNDLKFLLTTAYLGDLQLKVSGKDVDRGLILNQAKVPSVSFTENL